MREGLDGIGLCDPANLIVLFPGTAYLGFRVVATNETE
jgi:hypothetical protein